MKEMTWTKLFGIITIGFTIIFFIFSVVLGILKEDFAYNPPDNSWAQLIWGKSFLMMVICGMLWIWGNAIEGLFWLSTEIKKRRKLKKNDNN